MRSIDLKEKWRGIAVGALVLVLLGILIIGTVKEKREAERLAVRTSKPFASTENRLKTSTAAEIPEFVMPRKVYALASDAGNIEEMNIYYANVLRNMGSQFQVDVNSQYGIQYKDFFRIHPGETNVSHYAINSGSFDVSFGILNSRFDTVANKSTNIEIVPKTAAGNITVMFIGDSLTTPAAPNDPPKYVEHVAQKLESIKLVGTRTLREGAISSEGRGAWTVAQYLKAGSVDGMDSPFMFPKDIRGAKYRGNTEFWRKVIDPVIGKQSDFIGFQKLARDWGTQKKPYSFAPNGYPLHPQTDDVVFDPQKPEGQRFLKFDGSNWQVLNPQPGWEISFSKYFDRYSSAFTPKDAFVPPDIIGILLGTNDFQLSSGTSEGIENYISGIQTIIDNIHAYNPNIKVIVGTPIMGGDQDAWGKALGTRQTGQRFNANILELNQRILKQWDNDKAAAQKIWVAPLYVNVDPVYGFDYETEQANKYAWEKVQRQTASTWVHPSTSGYQQMGDVFAGVIQKIR